MLKQLCLILVSVGSVCLCVRAQGDGRVGLARDYGVKLCGREFIRAVIFTCGGSRWKRSENAVSLQSKPNPFLTGSYSKLPDNSEKFSWLQSGGAAVEHTNPPASSWADFFRAFGDFNSFEQDLGESLHLGSSGRWGLPVMLQSIQGGNANAPWPSPNRRKRNFSLGLAGMCCNQGCTKNDIGRLC